MIIIFVFLELPGVVLGEAFLSFLGLGINPPKASWGTLAQDGYASYQSHPYIIVIPSLCIAWLILSAFFVADGLRDALDPRRERTSPRRASVWRCSRSTTSAPCFKTREGEVRAVDGVSFELERGKTLGIVGESGCGKSVTALSIMGLVQPPGQVVGGSVRSTGGAASTCKRARARGHPRRARSAMIFQDPMTSLNPTLTIGTQITETLQPPPDMSRQRGAEARGRAARGGAHPERRSAASTTTRTATPAACASA